VEPPIIPTWKTETKGRNACSESAKMYACVPAGRLSCAEGAPGRPHSPGACWGGAAVGGRGRPYGIGTKQRRKFSFAACRAPRPFRQRHTAAAAAERACIAEPPP
jgi:hypothetical protein